MAKKLNLIRAACFSHRSPSLISLQDQTHYQVMAKLSETKKGKLSVEIVFFNLGTCQSRDKMRNFPNIGEAMDWIIDVFSLFEPDGAPEVLYLPEWSDEASVDQCFKTWTDTLFGQDPENKIIHKYEKQIDEIA